MTQFEINVAEKGINLFDLAINSHFYLTNAMTPGNIKENYGSTHPGEDNERNGGTSLDTFAYEASNMPNSYN
jgi:hypothetical protein